MRIGRFLMLYCYAKSVKVILCLFCCYDKWLDVPIVFFYSKLYLYRLVKIWGKNEYFKGGVSDRYKIFNEIELPFKYVCVVSCY